MPIHCSGMTQPHSLSRLHHCRMNQTVKFASYASEPMPLLRPMLPHHRAQTYQPPRLRTQVVRCETATKKKGTTPKVKRGQSQKMNIPQPSQYQQTLKRSFTVGGLGLHTGEYAYVRVRPALAGEGRYFVSVPPGTNSDRFSPEELEEHDLEELAGSVPAPDRMDEAVKLQLFTEYLAAHEAGEFDGAFIHYIAEVKGMGEQLAIQSDNESLPDEEVVPHAAHETVVLAVADNAITNCMFEEEKHQRMGPQFMGLRSGKFSVLSVEALLSALEACGVDNCRIEIEEGCEVPVVDGSAVGWAYEIQKSGLRTAYYSESDKTEKVRKLVYQPPHMLTVRDGERFITLIPGEKQRLTYGIDHAAVAPVIGKQWMTWCPEEDEMMYRWDLAAARVYYTNVERLYDLRRVGFIKGGTADCSIQAFGDRWYDMNKVRFHDDEPVRHSLSDFVGDLSLLGSEGNSGLPLGHIIAYKADHAMHLDFIKAIRDSCTDKDKVPFGAK